jgi:hypothetical protein
MRAIQKATGVDGMPAIADGLIGALEELSNIQAEDVQEDDDGDRPDDRDGGVVLDGVEGL